MSLENEVYDVSDDGYAASHNGREFKSHDSYGVSGNDSSYQQLMDDFYERVHSLQEPIPDVQVEKTVQPPSSLKGMFDKVAGTIKKGLETVPGKTEPKHDRVILNPDSLSREIPEVDSIESNEESLGLD